MTAGVTTAAVRETCLLMAAALRAARGGFAKGATIFFPHRTEGEPPLAAVLTHATGIIMLGGVTHQGRRIEFEPDERTQAHLRGELRGLRERSAPLDPATGLPVV